MTKDEYKVIKNPMRYFTPFEVWIDGEIVEWTGAETITKRVTRCLKAFRTQQKADDVICYWQEVASFRDATIE